MFRDLLLWLAGVPIFVIILLHLVRFLGSRCGQRHG